MLRACGLLVAGVAAACFWSVSGTIAASPEAGAELERPSDVDAWPAVGVTMRMNKEDPSLPWQLRHVRMEPGAYASFVEQLKYADGTIFAVSFHPVNLDTTETPPLYHGLKEAGFAMEVIDRSHPDGRRFYVFEPGASRAAALPAGNECAACHNGRGSFDGTFASRYPEIARRIERKN